MITVAALHLHPVKSCRGYAVDRVTLDALGLQGDRRFLVVDESGRFLTQRLTPRLAQVIPLLAADALTLTCAGHPPLAVPLPVRDGATREVTIWRDTVEAEDCGDAAAAWFAAVLAQPARLVSTGAAFSRPMRSPPAREGDEVAFTDAHPLLVIGEASLADLNQRLDFPLPMNRFRPNLVVRGAPAFAEDGWRRIRIGDVVLRASGPCARCVITTTDQETLVRDKEPLRTLATYRRDASGDVNFGQNYIHETKAGTIRQGDGIEIID